MMVNDLDSSEVLVSILEEIGVTDIKVSEEKIRPLEWGWNKKTDRFVRLHYENGFLSSTNNSSDFGLSKDDYFFSVSGVTPSVFGIPGLNKNIWIGVFQDPIENGRATVYQLSTDTKAIWCLNKAKILVAVDRSISGAFIGGSRARTLNSLKKILPRGVIRSLAYENPNLFSDMVTQIGIGEEVHRKIDQGWSFIGSIPICRGRVEKDHLIGQIDVNTPDSIVNLPRSTMWSNSYYFKPFIRPAPQVLLSVKAPDGTIPFSLLVDENDVSTFVKKLHVGLKLIDNFFVYGVDTAIDIASNYGSQKDKKYGSRIKAQMNMTLSKSDVEDYPETWPGF